MKLPGGDYSVYAAYRGNKQEIFAPDGKFDFLESAKLTWSKFCCQIVKSRGYFQNY